MTEATIVGQEEIRVGGWCGNNVSIRFGCVSCEGAGRTGQQPFAILEKHRRTKTKVFAFLARESSDFCRA